MAYAVFGGTSLPLLSTNHPEDTREAGGGEFRAFDGTERSTRTWSKRVFVRTTKPLTLAEQATFFTLIGGEWGGAVAMLTGDIVNGTPANFRITVVSPQPKKRSATVVDRRFTLRISEQ